MASPGCRFLQLQAGDMIKQKENVSTMTPTTNVAFKFWRPLANLLAPVCILAHSFMCLGHNPRVFSWLYWEE